MNWWLIALGWLAFYGLLFAYFKTRGSPTGVSFSGPITMWRAQHGLATLERTAKQSRFWNIWGGIGLGVALVGLVASKLMVLGGTYQIFTQPEAESMLESPRNYLVIPGVNDFLPLSAAPEIVLGLLIGMVVHEAGHAIMCYLYDIEVESTGLFFFLALPMGAFVEPDEESQAQADKLDRLRMFSGGIMNNMVFSLLAVLLLFGPVLGAIAVAPGAPVGGVFPHSPAAEAGLEEGDRITAINGDPIDTADDLEAVLSATTAETMTLEVNDEREVTVDRYVFITSVAGTTADSVSAGDRVATVDGTPVTTAAEFETALQTADGSVDVALADGTTITLTPGVETVATEGGPAAQAGLSTDEPFDIVAVDGTPVYTNAGLVNSLDKYSAGETVTVTVEQNGEVTDYEVTLNDAGQLGVQVGTGESDIAVGDFGVEYYPADNYLGVMQSGLDSGMAFLQAVAMLLFLPLMSLMPGVLFDFPGFTGTIQNYYVVEGSLSSVASLWFFGASVLFWGAWININLAIFNCLPTFALDGGHIWRDTVYVVFEKLPGVEPDGALASSLSTGVLILTLLALLGMIFSPFLL